MYLQSKVIDGFKHVPYKLGDIPHCVPNHIIGGHVPPSPPVSAIMVNRTVVVILLE